MMHFLEEFEVYDDENEIPSALEFIEKEEYNKENEQQLEYERQHAVKAGYNFSQFKKYIGPKITDDPDESYWVFLYESFCSYITWIGSSIDEWGAEMFEEEWHGKGN